VQTEGAKFWLQVLTELQNRGVKDIFIAAKKRSNVRGAKRPCCLQGSTTNSVESLNRSLRKIIKIRGGFPNEEAALKLLFLALRQAAKKWTMPIHHWREALNHFTILWPERMPALERVAS
jgi:transposase-like protein